MPTKKTVKTATKRVLKKKASPSSSQETSIRNPHLSIRALAGTGKTTTITWGCAGTPAGVSLSNEQADIIHAMQSENYKTARFTAFSKAIATELKSRLPQNVDSSTNHSLGLATIKANTNKTMIDANKTWKILEELFGSISESKNKRETINRYNQVKSIVSISKGTLTGDLEASQDDGVWTGDQSSIADTCSFYSVDYDDKALAMAAQVLVESSRRATWIDFDDMIWLPAIHNWQPEVVDFGIVDEAQDLNKAQLWLASHSCRRLCAIGDINQSIFGFAGADPSAIPAIESWMQSSPRGLTQLPLNETRRCGKEIVKFCNQLVPEFRSHPNNPEGLVRSSKYTKIVGEIAEAFTASENFMVLCRTNAPLTRLALQLLKNRYPVQIKGKQFAQGIINLIKKLAGSSSSTTALLGSLEDYESSETIAITSSTRPDADQKLLDLQDRCEIIRIFAEGCKEVDCVIQKFDELFSDENKKNCITLSSAHRSKGLEADKIFIIRPELLPHPKISEKSEFNRVQEHNLAYVAYSRAKHELVLVQSDDQEKKS